MLDIAILLYEGITALDAVGPYEVLARLPEARIQFVAKDMGPKLTDSGVLTLVPHYRLSDVPRPHVILVPGALTGFRAVMTDGPTLEWLAAAHATSLWTTSVCSGSLILGAAGLLKGLRATTHWMVMDYLAPFGAVPTPERVVRDGKVITAAGVSAGIDMALHLVREIEGEEFARAAQLMIEYDPQPPFDSGSTRTASHEVVEAARRGLLREATSSRGAGVGPASEGGQPRLRT
jgi:transcriptional regulator GlxA family with amidase domain